MTSRASKLCETIRAALADLDTLSPAEQDIIIGVIVSDLRARRPVAVSPLGVLPPPTERIRDPRVKP